MAEPSVSSRAYHDSGNGNLPVTRVVIHATCGSRGYPKESAKGVAQATANYFRSKSSGGSAHYVIDIATEIHCLPDRTIAWHAPPNSHSIGIEICADGGEAYGRFKPYTRTQWLSPQVKPALERAAKRTAELCKRHGVPARKLTVAQVRAGSRGICGHADVSAAFRQTDHTDPGPSFPWDEFMDMVTGAPSGEPTGEKAPAWPGRYLQVKSPMMHGADVRAWQAQMRGRGWGLAADGWYGPESEGVCRAFQREKGLDVDGVVGPVTWKAAWEAQVT